MGKSLQYLVDRFVECTAASEYRHIVPQTLLRQACPHLSDEEFPQLLTEAYKAGMLTLLSIEGGQRYISRGLRLWHARKKAA